MDDREQQRKIRHWSWARRRHAEEVSGNVAATCRCAGSAGRCCCRWRNRFEELGAQGMGTHLTMPHRDLGRSGEADRASAPELPLRSRSHRDVPEALPRRRDLPLRGVEGPAPAGSWPAAGQPAPTAPRPAPETLREAAPGPSGADRREAPSPGSTASRPNSTATSPPSRAAPGCACCASVPSRPAHHNRVLRLRHRAAPVPRRGDPGPTTARTTPQTGSPSCSPNGPSPTAAPSRTGPRPTARPNGSTAPSSTSSSAPGCSNQKPTGGSAWPAGSTITTATDSTPPLAARPHHARTTSREPTAAVTHRCDPPNLPQAGLPRA